jgi:hypothetical protein
MLTRVERGSFEVCVAEHLGDVADAGAAFEHQGGDGVAQEVTASFLVDPGWGEASPLGGRCVRSRPDVEIETCEVAVDRLRRRGPAIEPAPVREGSQHGALSGRPRRDEH